MEDAYGPHLQLYNHNQGSDFGDVWFDDLQWWTAVTGGAFNNCEDWSKLVIESYCKGKGRFGMVA